MPKVRIEGVGVVNLSDDFLDLSPEEQSATIDEIVSSHKAAPSPQPQFDEPSGPKSHWVDSISDVTGTIGSVAGGIGGGALGALTGPAAPVAIPGGAVAGSVAGGAAGGAFGEWIEGLIDPRGRRSDEIIDTAIQEGAWGLIPGVGGLATKAGLRAGASALSLIPRALGFTVKTPSEAILKGVSKFSQKELNKFFNESVLKKMSKTSTEKLRQVGINDLRSLNVLMNKTDPAMQKKIIKALKGDKDFEKLINNFYAGIAQRGVKRGGLVAAGGDLIQAQDPYRDKAEYAEGGEVGLLGTDITPFLNKYILGEKTQLSGPVTVGDAGKFVAELTPIVGDALAAKEVYDETQKDDPNWLLVGALGGAAVVGLIPGIGDAAAQAIKAGARAAAQGGEAAVKAIKANPMEGSASIDVLTGGLLGKKAPKEGEYDAETYFRGDKGRQTADPLDFAANPVPAGSQAAGFPKGVIIPGRATPEVQEAGIGGAPYTGKKLSKDVSKTGNPIVDDNIGMVFAAVKKYGIPTDQAQDAVQDGVEALLKASESYRPGSNTKFSTYAFQHVDNAVKNRAGIADPTKRRASIEAGKKTGGLLDEVGEDGLRLEEIIPDRRISDPDYFEKALGDDAELGRLLVEQAEIREGVQVIDGKRVPRLTDREIREQLGLSPEEFKEAKERIKRKLEKGSPADYQKFDKPLYRSPGKSHEQPEKFGPASEVRGLLG